MRVVLDSNVLISGLIRPDGPCGKVLALLEQGAFDLVVSPAILSEYRRAVTYPQVRKYLRLAPSEVSTRLARLELLADSVSGTSMPGTLPRDPDDAFLLAAADEGRADLVVSGDKDLLAHAAYGRFAIVSPRAFLHRIEGKGRGRQELA